MDSGVFEPSLLIMTTGGLSNIGLSQQIGGPQEKQLNYGIFAKHLQHWPKVLLSKLTKSSGSEKGLNNF